MPITSLERITPSLVSVVVSKPNHFEFRAGQYVVMRIEESGKPLLRQYSIASSPRESELEFLIQNELDGAVSSWFHTRAAVGIKISISQAFGNFVLDNEYSPVTLIAGRVGIAPFISMIRNHVSQNDTHHLKLLYSARGEADFCYKELLQTVKTCFFDTEKNERITFERLKKEADPTNRYYICGSKQFADAMTEQLHQLNIPAQHIKRELFTLQ